MNFPKDLRYSKEHEWARVSGSEVAVGITDHAQSSLGDIVFVELPKVGRKLKQGETFGVVESIKAVSDLYSPVEGEVVAINDAIVASPGQINQDPYTAGWLVKIKLSNPSSVESLMDCPKYEAFVKTLG